MEIITQLGIPNRVMICVTQLIEFCYAGRYASSPESKKTHHWNRIGSQWYALVSLCASSKNSLKQGIAAGRALPWGGEGVPRSERSRALGGHGCGRWFK